METEIQQKKLLKATVQKLATCVKTECVPTMDALRTALQARWRSLKRKFDDQRTFLSHDFFDPFQLLRR